MDVGYEMHLMQRFPRRDSLEVISFPHHTQNQEDHGKCLGIGLFINCSIAGLQKHHSNVAPVWGALGGWDTMGYTKRPGNNPLEREGKQAPDRGKSLCRSVQVSIRGSNCRSSGSRVGEGKRELCRNVTRLGETEPESQTDHKGAWMLYSKP